jgi:RNA polymerase sigma-70 factor (ECF subfamily)
VNSTYRDGGIELHSRINIGVAVDTEDGSQTPVVADADLAPALQAALDALPPEFRAVVVLCDIEGLSYEEVAASLGVKLGTVRSRLHRGRHSIRDNLVKAQRREKADPVILRTEATVG